MMKLDKELFEPEMIASAMEAAIKAHPSLLTTFAYNEDGECTAQSMSYIDRLCRTFKKERIQDIMQPHFRSRCRKQSGKYKVDGGRVLK